MKGKTITELSIGDSASSTMTITETHIALFAGVTGDFNPVHMDAEAAKESMFGKRISHGMLVGSLFSAVLANKLPGNGCIYLGQELRFMKPVFINDTITATVTVKEVIVEKNRVLLDTVATNQSGEVVISGVATIMPVKEG
jgi:3-hydroxybutyryl-CoA dehydratase